MVEWVAPGTIKPFITISPTELVIDLANAALSPVHAIYTGPVPIDLKSLPPGLVITTVGADQNQLVTFGRWHDPLDRRIGVLGSGNRRLRLQHAADLDLCGNSHGHSPGGLWHYNSASNTFVATRIEVGLQN